MRRGPCSGRPWGLVAATAGLFAVGAYLGRNLAYHWGWLLFIAGFGAAGYATRRDLSALARVLFWALIGLILFGIVTIFVQIPNGALIYAVRETRGPHDRSATADRAPAPGAGRSAAPATAVASRDGDLVAYDPGKVVELAGRVPTSRLFDDDLTGRSPKRWWTPWPTATRHSSPTRCPGEPGAAAASTRPASSCCLGGRDEGGFMVEHVMELLAAS